MQENDLLQERYELALGRIAQIPDEHMCDEAYQDYFARMARFVMLMDSTWRFVADGSLYLAPLEMLQRKNYELYEDILPKNYGHSYANPDYTVECLGESIGKILCFTCAELRGMIPAAYEQSLTGMVIRMELLLEIYQSITCEVNEESLRQIIYWYVSDYYEIQAKERLENLLLPERDFATRIIMESNLSDIRYLYYYCEYVTDS